MCKNIGETILTTLFKCDYVLKTSAFNVRLITVSIVQLIKRIFNVFGISNLFVGSQ